MYEDKKNEIASKVWSSSWAELLLKPDHLLMMKAIRSCIHFAENISMDLIYEIYKHIPAGDERYSFVYDLSVDIMRQNIMQMIVQNMPKVVCNSEQDDMAWSVSVVLKQLGVTLNTDCCDCKGCKNSKDSKYQYFEPYIEKISELIAQDEYLKAFEHAKQGYIVVTMDLEAWCRLYETNAYNALVWRYEGKTSYIVLGGPSSENGRELFSLDEACDLAHWDGEETTEEVWEDSKLLAEWNEKDGLKSYSSIPPWLTMETVHHVDGYPQDCINNLRQIVNDCDYWHGYSSEPSEDCNMIKQEAEEMLIIKFHQNFEDIDLLELVEMCEDDEWDENTIREFKSAVVKYITDQDKFNELACSSDDQEDVTVLDSNGDVFTLEGHVRYIKPLEMYLYWTLNDECGCENWTLVEDKKEWIKEIGKNCGTLLSKAVCHECGGELSWSQIQTGSPGSPNFLECSCSNCDYEGREEERGPNNWIRVK